MFLLRHWRAVGVALLFVALVGAVLAYGHRQYERGVADTKAEMQTALEKERELHRQVDWKVRQQYETRIANLNARVARELRGRSIHCVLGDSGEVRAGGNPSGSAGGSTGQPAVQPSADLRSLIVRRGETCEQMRQQLIAIKERQEELRGKAR